MTPSFDFDADKNDVVTRRRPARSSPFGISSFIIALLVGFFEFVLLLVAGYLSMREPEGLDEESPLAIGLGLLLIGGIMTSLVGAALGFVGLSQDEDKTFSIWGAVLNVLVILGVLGVIAVGLLME